MSKQAKRHATGIAIIMAPDSRILLFEKDGELTFLQKQVCPRGRGRSFPGVVSRVMGVEVNSPPRRISMAPDAKNDSFHIAYFFTVSAEEIQHHKAMSDCGAIVLKTIKEVCDIMTDSWHKHVLLRRMPT